MKKPFRKAVALILIIIFCAAAAITGFAVSAAGHSLVSIPTTPDHPDCSSRAALKDGVWQAVDENGGSRLFFINNEQNSFSIIHPDMGIGVPSRFEYNEALGMYKLHIAYEGNEEDWRVIDNNGRTAAVTDANGSLITLYYLSNDTADSLRRFTLNELSVAARAYYAAQHPDSDGVNFTVAMKTDGSFCAVITGEKDGAKAAVYTVDMQTGTGTDDNFNSVDLSRFVSCD